MLKRVENLGAGTLNLFEEAGRTFNLLLIVLWQLLQPPYRLYPIVRQTYFIGARSVTIIALSGVTIGMVIGLAFYTILVRFASVNLLGAGVVLSIVREIGPIMTALMVVGRAGSAMCAELGIMRISEQVDALECMAIDPGKYLVMPRVIAGLVSVPLLTAIFDFVAVFGGYFVGVVMFGMSDGSYMNSMTDALEWARELCGGRLVCVLEGGYSPGGLSQSVAATMGVLTRDIGDLVLLFDENLMTAKRVILQLERGGYRVNGYKDFPERPLDESPQIVLINLGTRAFEEGQLIEKCRVRFPEARIIGFCGHREVELRRAAKAAGIDKLLNNEIALMEIVEHL